MKLRYIALFFLLFILNAGICKGKGMAVTNAQAGFKPTAQLLSKANVQSKAKNLKSLFTQAMAIDATVMLQAPSNTIALYNKSFVALQRWDAHSFMFRRFYEQRNIGVVPDLLAKLLFPVHYFW